jgi:hypothetical protein
VVLFVGRAAAAVIVAGILLVVFDANQGNQIVEAVTDAARWLTGPFHELFTIENRDWRVVVNWGLAAIAYLVVSRFVARLFAR